MAIRDPTPVSSSLQTRLELYRTMYLIRRAEEILMAEYHPADQVRCPMHFCVGQEAMPSALARVIRPNDILMSHYRSHGYYGSYRPYPAACEAVFFPRNPLCAGRPAYRDFWWTPPFYNWFAYY